MSTSVISKRYAEVLFELGQENGVLEELKNDMDFVVRTVSEHEELQKVVQHKILAEDKKRAVFQKIFAEEVSKLTFNFLLLLLQKNREYYLQEIYEEFINTVDEYHGIVEAEVTSAVELTDEERQRLQERLSNYTGKEVRLKEYLEPNLIGGLVVKIGDKVIDGSVKNKLNLLKHHLKQTELA